LPASHASVALMISLVIDAVTDPLVGSLSEKIAFTFSPPAGLAPDGLFAWLLGGFGLPFFSLIPISFEEIRAQLARNRG